MTWDRDGPLVKKGWVTRQQGDVDLQNLKAQEAAVAAAKHNVTAQENLVKQLHQNRDYASVVAPFDGVITQRNVDVGSLVQGNATSGTFMFEIMQEDVIRVSVYVPQDAAFGVAPGIDAIVRVPELPDREFPGTVTRIADALQPGTRTLLTEIDIPNPDGALPPGIYCTVELKFRARRRAFQCRPTRIIFNRDGMQVAVVNNGKAEIRKVRVKRDLGTRVEVDAGIKAGDQVILNPPVTPCRRQQGAASRRRSAMMRALGKSGARTAVDGPRYHRMTRGRIPLKCCESAEQSTELVDLFSSTVPLGRWGEPEELAKAVPATVSRDHLERKSGPKSP